MTLENSGFMSHLPPLTRDKLDAVFEEEDKRRAQLALKVLREAFKVNPKNEAEWQAFYESFPPNSPSFVSERDYVDGVRDLFESTADKPSAWLTLKVLTPLD